MVTPDRHALHVLHRLTYGPRPGDWDRLRTMGTEAYIQGQLSPQALPITLQTRLAQLPDFHESPVVLFERHGLPARQRAIKQGQSPANIPRAETLNSAIAARLWRATESPWQLQELLTEFWFNHFNVFSGKGYVYLFLADYERNAIYPHSLGSFRQLLGAVVKHPAMLLYLDNGRNRVPRRSVSGTSYRTVNENLARELLELHTLGGDGGYDQGDIQALARILTGWGVVSAENIKKTGIASSGVYFREEWHDFTPKTLLGYPIPGDGPPELDRALDILAAHASTARHLCLKLAQTFIGDRPPEDLIQSLAKTYQTTQGDLRAVLGALVTSGAFTAPPFMGNQFKSPYRYVLSVIRAGGGTIHQPQRVQGWLSQLSMPLYGCLTPDGYRLQGDRWLNPDGLLRRLALVESLPQSIRTPARPQRPLDLTSPLTGPALMATLGPLFTPQTQRIVAAQPARRKSPMIDRQGSLLLGSPEFMYC